MIHMFDDFEDWDAQRPWMVCSSLRCQGEVDHLSASVINARVPVLFSGGAGLVLSPSAELLCSYAYDSGTQGKTNGGCGAVPCPSHPRAWECSWPPDYLRQMMEAQATAQSRLPWNRAMVGAVCDLSRPSYLT